MAKFVKSEIIFHTGRRSVDPLRAPIAAHIVARSEITLCDLPSSYHDRVGIKFADRGRVLAPWLSGRLAATLGEARTHAEYGVASIPFSALR